MQGSVNSGNSVGVREVPGQVSDCSLDGRHGEAINLDYRLWRKLRAMAVGVPADLSARPAASEMDPVQLRYWDRQPVEDCGRHMAQHAEFSKSRDRRFDQVAMALFGVVRGCGVHPAPNQDKFFVPNFATDFSRFEPLRDEVLVGVRHGSTSADFRPSVLKLSTGSGGRLRWSGVASMGVRLVWSHSAPCDELCSLCAGGKVPGRVQSGSQGAE